MRPVPNRRLVVIDIGPVFGERYPLSSAVALAPLHARPLPLAGGHHFGGDYDGLAGHILGAIER